jgi:hypothetical protein
MTQRRKKPRAKSANSQHDRRYREKPPFEGDASKVQAKAATKPPPATLASAKIPQRSSELNNSRTSSPEIEPSGRFRRLLGSPTWQGIAGISGIVALVASIGIFLYTLHLQRVSSQLQQANATANIEIATTYQYNGSGRWTMNAAISNNGPAVAKAIRIDYSAVHTVCVETRLLFVPGKRTKVSVRNIKSDLQCPGGGAFIDAKQRRSLPGLFIHPLARLSASPGWGLVSGTAYNVHPDEVIWIDFHFKVAPDLNRKLLKALPTHAIHDVYSPTKIIAPFFAQFKQVDVRGDNIRVSTTSYNAVDLSQK